MNISVWIIQKICKGNKISWKKKKEKTKKIIVIFFCLPSDDAGCRDGGMIWCVSPKLTLCGCFLLHLPFCIDHFTSFFLFMSDFCRTFADKLYHVTQISDIFLQRKKHFRKVNNWSFGCFLQQRIFRIWRIYTMHNAPKGATNKNECWV